MNRWARTMRQVLDHDEFVELVESEVRSEKITSEAGEIALAESQRLSLDHECQAP